jgi:hypothetical protein
MLEKRGIVGPGDGAKPREVYGAPNNSTETVSQTSNESDTEKF